MVGQLDCRVDQTPPRKPPALGPSEMQTRDGTRHANGEVAIVVLIRVVLAVGKEHRRGGGRWSDLAEVVRHRLTGDRADQHEAAATDVPGRWVGDGQGKRRGHGCIDGRPPLAEHVEADTLRVGLLRHDHSATGANRL